MNMRWRLNSCRDHRKNASLLASGLLPEAEQASLRDHLEHCAKCREYYEEIAKLTGQFQQWATTEPPIQVGAAFRARWMRAVQTAGGPTRTSPADLISRWTQSLWPSPAAWGALAAVWICLLFLQWDASGQRATDQGLAGNPPSGTEVTFVQRQRELASLLESLAPRPAASSLPELPRPRSQRRVEFVAA